MYVTVNDSKSSFEVQYEPSVSEHVALLNNAIKWAPS